MSRNRLTDEAADPTPPAADAEAAEAVELTDRGRESLLILNALFDDPGPEDDCCDC